MSETLDQKATRLNSLISKVALELEDGIGPDSVFAIACYTPELGISSFATGQGREPSAVAEILRRASEQIARHIASAGPAWKSPFRVVGGDEPDPALAKVVRALALLHEAIAVVGLPAMRGIEDTAALPRLEAALDVAADAIREAGLAVGGGR